MNTRINQCSETLCNNLEKKVASNETFDLKECVEVHELQFINLGLLVSKMKLISWNPYVAACYCHE